MAATSVNTRKTESGGSYHPSHEHFSDSDFRTDGSREMFPLFSGYSGRATPISGAPVGFERWIVKGLYQS